jgi:hypothetical protein
MEFKEMPLVYPALSKHLFYFKGQISKYVLEQNCVPLNPFMIFEYFLMDTVNRDLVRNGNNNLVRRADRLWVFGAISDGVFNEIRLAKSLGKPLRYFEVIKSKDIIEISLQQARFEDGLEKFIGELSA